MRRYICVVGIALAALGSSYAQTLVSIGERYLWRWKTERSLLTRSARGTRTSRMVRIVASFTTLLALSERTTQPSPQALTCLSVPATALPSTRSLDGEDLPLTGLPSPRLSLQDRPP
jgi:hypothetical protein